MKSFFALVGLASLALGVPSTLQQPEPVDSCHFTVSRETTKPTITGPEDLTPLVYIVDQPDSPAEIVSMDLTGYVLSVAQERFTFKDCWTMKVRNRSDQPVNGLEVMVLVSSRGFGPGPGFSNGPSQVESLGAGQEAEIRSCNGGGTGDARGDQVRIFAFVERVRMNKCVYLPSKRIPYELAGPSPVPSFHSVS
jgi:hypothetical protein